DISFSRATNPGGFETFGGCLTDGMRGPLRADGPWPAAGTDPRGRTGLPPGPPRPPPAGGPLRARSRWGNQGALAFPAGGVPTTPGGPAPNQRGQLMHETLLTAEWKKVLGASPPPDAGPLTKKLEGYAKLKGKADAEDEAQALQEINVLALSLKKKLARDA